MRRRGIGGDVDGLQSFELLPFRLGLRGGTGTCAILVDKFL